MQLDELPRRSTTPTCGAMLSSFPTPPPSPGPGQTTAPSVAAPAIHYAPSTGDNAAVSKKKERRRAILREVACHLALVAVGWADASSGPLLPYMQDYYHLTYTIVSMLFVGTMVGSFVTGATTGPLTRKFGMGAALIIGACAQSIAYTLLIPAFPFPLLPILFAFSGFGAALQNAQANAYVAGLPNAESRLGYLHASYGIGATISPLAGAAFTSSGILFSRFYAVSLGLVAINIVIVLLAFPLNYRIDTSEKQASAVAEPVNEVIELPERPAPAITSPSPTAVPNNASAAEEGRSPSPPTRAEASKVHRMRASVKASEMYEILSSRTAVFSALFIFLYTGAEVAMGGWIVTYLLERVDNNPDVAFTASGFWGGIAVGRLILIPVTAFMGERLAMLVYTGLALSLEFAIWFHRDLISNAVVVALIGLLMGPSYTICISTLTKLLPRRLHARAIAVLAACGQVGSATFPLLTGALSQRFSPAVLQPIMVCLFVGQLAAWAGVPKVERKTE